MEPTKKIITAETIAKMKEMIKTSEVGILTTSLIRMPLSIHTRSTHIDDDGTIWFNNTAANISHPDILADKNVTLYYSSSTPSQYLTIHGSASVNLNKEKPKGFWKSVANAFKTSGFKLPTLQNVKPLEIQYWDKEISQMVSLLSPEKATLSAVLD